MLKNLEINLTTLIMQKKRNYIPKFSRSRDIIEPIIKPQWYVKTDEMARKALDAVKNGKLSFIPEFYVDTWNRWLEDIR